MARLFLVLRRSDRSRQGPLADFGGGVLRVFEPASQERSVTNFSCLSGA
jgi:hypothetical protein